MEITELPATPLVLRPGEDPVYLATQRWALEPWDGEDSPDVPRPWGIKPKFAVNGRRSCAELAILDHLRGDGWDGVWVNAFGPGELRSEWFPAPAVNTLAEVGAPAWAVQIFDRLRAANGGKLSGFFDVFAWRDPDQIRFYEAKVGSDPIKPTQLRFVKLALDLHLLPEQFAIIKIPGYARAVHRA